MYLELLLLLFYSLNIGSDRFEGFLSSTSFSDVSLYGLYLLIKVIHFIQLVNQIIVSL